MRSPGRAHPLTNPGVLTGPRNSAIDGGGGG